MNLLLDIKVFGSLRAFNTQKSVILSRLNLKHMQLIILFVQLLSPKRCIYYSVLYQMSADVITCRNVEV